MIDDDQFVELRPGLGPRHHTSTATRSSPSAAIVDVGSRGRGEGRLSRLHAQGDPRAARRRSARRCAAGCCLTARLRLDQMRLSDDELRAVDKVFIVGCGTSYHAGLVAKYAIEHWARLAGRERHRQRVPLPRPGARRRTRLVVGVSQSGETLDTMEACRYAAAATNKAKVLAVCNVVDSSMAREADAVLYTRAGPEVGVAVDQDARRADRRDGGPGAVISRSCGARCTRARSQRLVEGARRALPDRVEEVLARTDDIVEVAPEVPRHARDFFFLGRGVGYAVALEGRAEAQGDQLRAGRGLSRRRDEARSDRVDRAGNGGGGRRDP